MDWLHWRADWLHPRTYEASPHMDKTSPHWIKPILHGDEVTLVLLYNFVASAPRTAQSISRSVHGMYAVQLLVYFLKYYFSHLHQQRTRWLTTKRFITELDGVGPVNNRPSTDWLKHFVKFFHMKKLSCEKGHVTCGMSHMTHDTWREVNIL